MKKETEECEQSALAEKRVRAYSGRRPLSAEMNQSSQNRKLEVVNLLWRDYVCFATQRRMAKIITGIRAIAI
jgi:hypothetical protein